MSYEIDKKTKGKIINALRRLTYSYPPRNEVKRLRKVDKALYSCELCHRYCYEGKSKKTYIEYAHKYPDREIVMEHPHIDHKNPVVPIQKGWEWDWNDFINNMFCPKENLQLICVICHTEKTTEEQQRRTQIRRESKVD